MKICPNCHTQYTDDSLRFCLQDGSLLTAAADLRQPTVSLGGKEPETTADRQDGPSIETRWRQDSEVTRFTVPPARSGARWLLWAVTAGSLFVILGAAGVVGLWLYLKDRPAVAVNTDNRERNQNSKPPFDINTNLQPPTRTPFPPPTPTASATPSNVSSTVRDMQLSAEVSQQVESWGSSTELGDINSLVSRYAPSVQYYRKNGATPEFIRADKQRAYRMFDSMSIRISNMDVNVGDSGETATANFDKEWVFEGARRSTGKVRQQLQFRKISGRWLIIAERDVKVYYSN